MRLIFIRHGDPDYKHDTLTKKGECEAIALQRRVQRWLGSSCLAKLDAVKNKNKTIPADSDGKDAAACKTADTFDFYVSPLRRAKRTAETALRCTGYEAKELPWLREFSYPVKDPRTGLDHLAWDWMPAWLAEKEQSPLKDPDKWMRTAIMQSGDIASRYGEVCRGLDEVLEHYGFERDGTLPGVYRTDGTHCQHHRLDKSTDTYKDYHDSRIAVFFCHLGVTFAAISHLLAISPVTLWQSFFAAPASLTILGSEEREPGTAAFRVQTLGDTQHLHDNNEDISASGYFTDVFAL